MAEADEIGGRLTGLIGARGAPQHPPSPAQGWGGRGFASAAAGPDDTAAVERRARQYVEAGGIQSP